MLIIGLGNPGLEYSDTVHNLGKITISFLRNMLTIDRNIDSNIRVLGELKCSSGDVIKYLINGKLCLKVISFNSFINLSAESLMSMNDYLNVVDTNEPIIIIFDDVTIPKNRVIMSRKRGSSGHNGAIGFDKHFSEHDIWKIRIGYQKPDCVFLKDFVLTKIAHSDNIFTTMADLSEVLYDSICELGLYEQSLLVKKLYGIQSVINAKFSIF